MRPRLGNTGTRASLGAGRRAHVSASPIRHLHSGPGGFWVGMGGLTWLGGLPGQGPLIGRCGNSPKVAANNSDKPMGSCKVGLSPPGAGGLCVPLMCGMGFIWDQVSACIRRWGCLGGLGGHGQAGGALGEAAWLAERALAPGHWWQRSSANVFSCLSTVSTNTLSPTKHNIIMFCFEWEWSLFASRCDSQIGGTFRGLKPAPLREGLLWKGPLCSAEHLTFSTWVRKILILHTPQNPKTNILLSTLLFHLR